MKTLTHTIDSQRLAEFADKYPLSWHSFSSHKKTLRAVERARLLGRIIVNEFNQFKAIDKDTDL